MKVYIVFNEGDQGWGCPSCGYGDSSAEVVAVFATREAASAYVKEPMRLSLRYRNEF